MGKIQQIGKRSHEFHLWCPFFHSSLFLARLFRLQAGDIRKAVKVRVKTDHRLHSFVSHAGNSQHIREIKECKRDRKSTRLNSSHQIISYAVFCLKKKKKNNTNTE